MGVGMMVTVPKTMVAHVIAISVESTMKATHVCQYVKMNMAALHVTIITPLAINVWTLTTKTVIIVQKTWNANQEPVSWVQNIGSCASEITAVAITASKRIMPNVIVISAVSTTSMLVRSVKGYTVARVLTTLARIAWKTRTITAITVWNSQNVPSAQFSQNSAICAFKIMAVGESVRKDIIAHAIVTSA